MDSRKMPREAYLTTFHQPRPSISALWFGSIINHIRGDSHVDTTIELAKDDKFKKGKRCAVG